MMKKATVAMLDCVWLSALAVCTIFPFTEGQWVMLFAVSIRTMITFA